MRGPETGHCGTSGGISKVGETVGKFEHETAIHGTGKLFYVPIRHSKSTQFIQKQVMRNKAERTANVKET